MRRSSTESKGREPTKEVKRKIEEGEQPEVDKYGTKIWRNNKGQLHSYDDHPAIIYADGEMSWYKNGILIKKETK